jgi:N-glycosylase/DNA lyase
VKFPRSESKHTQFLTIETVRETHRARQAEIKKRLTEFAAVGAAKNDKLLFEEMVFCIFTANASARMGLRSVAAIKNLLPTGTQTDFAHRLSGVHRFPNARAAYVAATRDFLLIDCKMRLHERLSSFQDPAECRDWLAQTKEIKGLGYKEASHFLRNIGFSGLAILDKHILNCLAELRFINDPKPPANRKQYLATEAILKNFAQEIQIDFDELDLVLWSIKTGEILK